MSGKSLPDRLTTVDDAGRTIYYDEGRRTYHTWCDQDEYEPVSSALIEAMASLRDVAPTDLETLSGRVDSDALNEMVAHWQADRAEPVGASIRFGFAGCRVTVWADGEIVIDPGSSDLATN
ncbi:HalOD1 output domain-containing protein [Natrarchaeobius sp. A-rgal3]|uniref:HalOD1 output domain-containing protein n=1 Tax=Natrarchaeobius versutus TaxID=1679078 RepID=UPI00350F3769